LVEEIRFLSTSEKSQKESESSRPSSRQRIASGEPLLIVVDERSSKVGNAMAQMWP
jgi:hypothetical protein